MCPGDPHRSHPAYERLLHPKNISVVSLSCENVAHKIIVLLLMIFS